MQEIQYSPIRSSNTLKTAPRREHYSQPNNSLERTPQRDKVEMRAKRQHQRDKRNQTKGFMAGIAVALTIMGGGKAAMEAVKPPEANFNTNGHSISEIAEFYDIDPRAIALVNNLEIDDETPDKIIMPQKADMESDLAEVYTVDGSKFVYIIPNDYGILGEDIKEAFGIEDGVLRKYNDLPYTWGIDESVEVHQGYRDYTTSTIPYEGVKVPLGELN